MRGEQIVLSAVETQKAPAPDAAALDAHSALSQRACRRRPGCGATRPSAYNTNAAPNNNTVGCVGPTRLHRRHARDGAEVLEDGGDALEGNQLRGDIAVYRFRERRFGGMARSMEEGRGAVTRRSEPRRAGARSTRGSRAAA